MEIQLKKYIVKVRENLGWYALQEIKGELYSGAKLDSKGLTGYDGGAMLKAKVKVWESAIEEIKEGEKKVPFSVEWIKGLDEEDGNKIDETLNKLYPLGEGKKG